MTAVSEYDRRLDFTPAGYVALVQSFAGRGYEIRSYRDAGPAKAHVILRHDIDFDLGAAVRMGEAERAKGWRAHYFVLLRTEFYNPFSRVGREHLRALCAQGHEVGLHFDASQYPGDLEGLRAGVRGECAILEQAIGQPVSHFSLHRPSPGLVDRGFAVEQKINAYAPRYVQEIGYCSDSRGAWDHGHPLDHPRIGANKALQLLTHPLWWFEGQGTSQRSVEYVLDRRYANLEREAAANCVVYRPRTPNPAT